MISTLKAVIKKEWRDSVRDRRSMSAAFLFAISGPILIALMLTTTAEENSSQETVSVLVEGAEKAQDLVSYLENNRIEVQSATDLPAEPAEVTVVIPEDYRQRFEDGQSVTLLVTADRSKSSVRRSVARVETVLRRYSASLGQLRLSLRGVAPSVGTPLVIESRDLATRAARVSTVLGVVTIYFLLAAFIGSMAVSIDVAAGERERNSLEVLMAQPISAFAVFAGKTAVASVFGALGVALTIVVSQLAFVRIPLEEIGLTWSIDWWTASRIFLSLLPLAVMVAALQIGLSLWAKTFKEASFYLNGLMFVPMGVALFLQVKEIDSVAWMYSVPLVGHQQMLRSMIRAEALEPGLVVLLTLSTLTVAALFIYAGGLMLSRERIVFGQSD